MPTDHLDALSAEERLTLFTNAGTLLLLAEILVCWLFGEIDPLGKQQQPPLLHGRPAPEGADPQMPAAAAATAGGMDWNMQSARAALLGAAYGLPLVLCSLAARSDLFKRSFPVLDQLHEQQAGLQKHFITGGSQQGCSVCLTSQQLGSPLTHTHMHTHTHGSPQQAEHTPSHPWVCAPHFVAALRTAPVLQA